MSTKMPHSSDPSTEPVPSIEELAQTFRTPLLRHFQRRGLTREAAEDCVQEVFVRIAKADLESVKDAAAFLFTIASRVAIDRARRAHSRREQDHEPLENFSLASEEASPARVFESREALLRLDGILRELPPRTRELFLLNRLDGLSYTQLAARLGISVSRVEKLMAKALNHIRKRFADDDRA